MSLPLGGGPHVLFGREAVPKYSLPRQRQGPADFPTVRDTTPLTKPRSQYFGLGCTAFRRAAYSNVGAMEFGA